MSFWSSKRITVTGGAGFLGSFVVEKLRTGGCRDIFVPRSSQYDLVDMEAVKRMYRDARPDIVIHLAARVGGIGANRANPGRFFYDNAMMGIQLFEQGRLFGVAKFVALGTVCAYPKFAPAGVSRPIAPEIYLASSLRQIFAKVYDKPLGGTCQP